jgi:hypothetical protein
MTNLDTIPTLEALPVDGCTDQWKVWCDYCKAFHFHGAVEGHRQAHCDYNGSSPYLKTGYVIAGPVSSSIPSISKAV